MTERDEGVIKFECRHKPHSPFACPTVDELITYRQKLFDIELIGVYSDGIGYGNLSMRCPDQPEQFYISGSQTGHLKALSAAHFAKVTDCSIENNWIDCSGPIKASSESLTHAMIYKTFPEINAVIHVHNQEFWQKLTGTVPTTGVNVPYGTPAMAEEIIRLAKQEALSDSKILVMAGHEEGILSFGIDLLEAARVLSKHLLISPEHFG